MEQSGHEYYPKDPFATVMFPFLVECAQKVSEKDFSKAADILRSFNESCKGLFDSMFFCSEKSVEDNMKKYFGDVENLFNAGCHGEGKALDCVVKESLLIDFCTEYRSMLESLELACRLMQLVDVSVSNVFFEHCSDKLILKTSRIESIIDFSNNRIERKEGEMFPGFVLCAEKASEGSFIEAANILCSVELDCQNYLTSAWISSMKDITSHLKEKFDKVKNEFKRGMHGKNQTIGNVVKKALLNDFYFEYGCVLEKLMRARELMLIMSTMGFDKYFERSSEGLVILQKCFVENDIRPTRIPTKYRMD